MANRHLLYTATHSVYDLAITIANNPSSYTNAGLHRLFNHLTNIVSSSSRCGRHGAENTFSIPAYASKCLSDLAIHHSPSMSLSASVAILRIAASGSKLWRHAASACARRLVALPMEPGEYHDVIDALISLRRLGMTVYSAPLARRLIQQTRDMHYSFDGQARLAYAIAPIYDHIDNVSVPTMVEGLARQTFRMNTGPSPLSLSQIACALTDVCHSSPRLLNNVLKRYVNEATLSKEAFPIQDSIVIAFKSAASLYSLYPDTWFRIHRLLLQSTSRLTLFQVIQVLSIFQSLNNDELNDWQAEFVNGISNVIPSQLQSIDIELHIVLIKALTSHTRLLEQICWSLNEDISLEDTLKVLSAIGSRRSNSDSFRPPEFLLNVISSQFSCEGGVGPINDSQAISLLTATVVIHSSHLSHSLIVDAVCQQSCRLSKETLSQVWRLIPTSIPSRSLDFLLEATMLSLDSLDLDIVLPKLSRLTDQLRLAEIIREMCKKLAPPPPSMSHLNLAAFLSFLSAHTFPVPLPLLKWVCDSWSQVSSEHLYTMLTCFPEEQLIDGPFFTDITTAAVNFPRQHLSTESIFSLLSICWRLRKFQPSLMDIAIDRVFDVRHLFHRQAEFSFSCQLLLGIAESGHRPSTNKKQLLSHCIHSLASATLFSSLPDGKHIDLMWSFDVLLGDDNQLLPLRSVYSDPLLNATHYCRLSDMLIHRGQSRCLEAVSASSLREANWQLKHRIERNQLRESASNTRHPPLAMRAKRGFTCQKSGIIIDVVNHDQSRGTLLYRRRLLAQAGWKNVLYLCADQIHDELEISDSLESVLRHISQTG